MMEPWTALVVQVMTPSVGLCTGLRRRHSISKQAYGARQLHPNGFGLEADKPAQVVLVPDGRQSPLVGGVSRADAVVILAEGDIQDPMVGIFDAPVLAHRLQ